MLKWLLWAVGIVVAAVLSYYLISWILSSIFLLALVALVIYLIYKRISR